MLFRSLIVSLVFAALFAAPAFAASGSATKSLGVFDVWTTSTYNENGQPVCFMAAKIPVTKTKKLKRGAAWLTITHRPGENSKDVVSYTSGYNFKASSDVDVHIGKDDFNLFTQKDTAWSRDSLTDHQFAAAIRKNASMTVTGVPAVGGGSVTDTVSLKGADAAYHAIGKACGYADDASKLASTHKKKAPTKP